VPIREIRDKPLLRLAMAAVAIGLFLVGYYWGNRHQRYTSTLPVIEGILIRPARPLPDFILLDTAGQPFTAGRLAGHWTLLSFGNPSQAFGQSAITRMIEIFNRLANAPNLREQLLLVLVILRPDGPTLALDFEHSSPVLTLLSGTTDELQRLRMALGMPLQAPSLTPDLAIPCYLIDPSGRLLALFPDAQTPASIASDLVQVFSTTDHIEQAISSRRD